MFACVYVHHVHSWCSGGQKRMSYPLEVELQTTVSCLMWPNKHFSFVHTEATNAPDLWDPACSLAAAHRYASPNGTCENHLSAQLRAQHMVKPQPTPVHTLNGQFRKWKVPCEWVTLSEPLVLTSFLVFVTSFLYCPSCLCEFAQICQRLFPSLEIRLNEEVFLPRNKLKKQFPQASDGSAGCLGGSRGFLQQLSGPIGYWGSFIIAHR